MWLWRDYIIPLILLLSHYMLRGKKIIEVTRLMWVGVPIPKESLKLKRNMSYLCIAMRLIDRVMDPPQPCTTWLRACKIDGFSFGFFFFQFSVTLLWLCREVSFYWLAHRLRNSGPNKTTHVNCQIRLLIRIFVKNFKLFF